MFTSRLTTSSLRLVRCRIFSLPSPPLTSFLSSSLLCGFPVLTSSMDTTGFHKPSSSSSAFAHSIRRGRGRGWDNNERSGARGGAAASFGKDKIDALGRLLTRILRHMASELNLNMRNDGYVKVQDLLKLNLKTFANVPLRSHTVDDVKEAVRKDNKQRFGLLEENGELLIRANQGHTVKIVEIESLLKPILSADEVPGMRRDVNVLIFLDVRRALQDGMKLYISDNRVILTEGFDGAVHHGQIENLCHYKLEYVTFFHHSLLHPSFFLLPCTAPTLRFLEKKERDKFVAGHSALCYFPIPPFSTMRFILTIIVI